MMLIMQMAKSSCEYFIAGAGPVGLLLAILLADKGHSVVIVDPRKDIDQHSRAIGIHPPGLAALSQAGLIDRFIGSGITVKGGQVWVNRTWQGRMSFDDNPDPWKYPLIMPQYVTEKLLEEAVNERSTIDLRRGWELAGWSENAQGLIIDITNDQGEQAAIQCQTLIGSDGKRSRVRQLANIGWTGGAYRDRYLLGDFHDETDFGDDAIIHLHKKGLVESFPLPGTKRRWVIRLNDISDYDKRDRSSYETDTQVFSEKIRDVIMDRLGWAPGSDSCLLAGSFGIERWIADTFVSGRVLLAGDAAHVVSPIGGQGMNLGWMDAMDIVNRPSEYAIIGHKRARKAIRRAWFNTLLGRDGIPGFLHKAAVQTIVSSSLRGKFARQFTMSDF